MRKIFRIAYLALSLGVVLACKKEYVPEEPQGTYPILFSCSDETRAVATVESMQGDANGFDVYAFFNTPVTQNLSFDKNVKYDNGSWTYQHDNQELEYWLPGATYWFKAVYPNTINYQVDNSTQEQQLTILGFDITKQQDILVATTGALVVDTEIQAPTSGSMVKLQFQHLLANVVVEIKAEVNVTIYDVSLKYVPVKGTYDDGLWKDYSEQGNIEKAGINKSLSSSSNEYHDVTDGGFLVFPNSSVDGSQHLYIRTSDKTYDLPLPSTPNKWVAGNRYTYTLVIKQNDILFDEPTVEEWDEENATGSVVIK